jgi:hypothetical protein
MVYSNTLLDCLIGTRFSMLTVRRLLRLPMIFGYGVVGDAASLPLLPSSDSLVRSALAAHVKA